MSDASALRTYPYVPLCDRPHKLLTLVRPADGWISVEQALPDDEITVLAHMPEESDPVWPAFHDGAVWRLPTLEVVKVTHWRHFPTPPRTIGGGK